MLDHHPKFARACWVSPASPRRERGRRAGASSFAGHRPTQPFSGRTGLRERSRPAADFFAGTISALHLYVYSVPEASASKWIDHALEKNDNYPGQNDLALLAIRGSAERRNSGAEKLAERRG